MSPYHLHRLFKAETGLTPKPYASAFIAQRMRAGLGQGQSTDTVAIYQAGYNSKSRFYQSADLRLGMRPRQFRVGGTGASSSFTINRKSTLINYSH